MKKSFLIYCLGALFMFSIVSCGKTDDTEILEVENLTQDEIQFMGPGIQMVLPDLRVTSISSSLNVNNVCPGVPSADATCTGGGSNSFTITSTVKNQSPVAVNSPFQFEICIYNQLCGIATINGLAAGASETRTFSFSLPCASGPPPYALIQETAFAFADRPNVIAESKENNNNSERYPICRNQ